MDFQNISTIVFIFLMLFFLILKRKKITLQKIIFPIIYFAMYRTRMGLKFMNKFSKKFPKTLKYVSYVSITLGFVGMVLIIFSLLHNLYKLLLIPTATAAVVPVLPFKIKGAFFVPFFYWIISIFIIAVVHEFSHGIFARLYNIKIKSSGFAFLAVLLPVLPAAFVEPDENQLKKKPVKEQLSIYAAGPFSNILLAFVILAISFLIIPQITNALVDYNGIQITGFIKENNTIYPAEIAGLKKGDIITSINNVPTPYLENFTSVMNSTKPGETIVLQTDTKAYAIKLAHHPENYDKSYLGIYVSQSSKIKTELKQKLYFIPDIILWLLGLLYWLYLLNLGIGLFNLVPIGPIDGGRMLKAVLQKYFEKKKAERIWKFVSGLLLSLVLINLFFAFVR